MSNQYRAQMVNSAHMANNPLGINVDDIAGPICRVAKNSGFRKDDALLGKNFVANK